MSSDLRVRRRLHREVLDRVQVVAVERAGEPAHATRGEHLPDLGLVASLVYDQVGREDTDLVMAVQAGLDSRTVLQGRLMGDSERLIADYMPSRFAPRNRVVEITRGGQGNFAVAAHLNSARVSMVLDTGASTVVLTQDAARAAGLPVEVLTYTVAIDTANGRTRAAPVTLNSIAVGGIVKRSVPALIAQPGQLRTNLLGMTFLNRLESWEVRGDKLVMRAYP